MCLHQASTWALWSRLNYRREGFTQEFAQGFSEEIIEGFMQGFRDGFLEGSTEGVYNLDDRV